MFLKHSTFNYSKNESINFLYQSLCLSSSKCLFQGLYNSFNFSFTSSEPYLSIIIFVSFNTSSSLTSVFSISLNLFKINSQDNLFSAIGFILLSI